MRGEEKNHASRPLKVNLIDKMKHRHTITYIQSFEVNLIEKRKPHPIHKQTWILRRVFIFIEFKIIVKNILLPKR